MRCSVLGHSIEERPIELYRPDGWRSGNTLVLGGFHGDEPKGVYVAKQCIELIDQSHSGAPSSGAMAVMPIVNPDGYARRRRRNANKVDINRNFPTSNWERGDKRHRMFGGESAGSEAETQAVIRAVDELSPGAIITIHSISDNLHCNNFDGSGKPLAQLFAACNGYPVTGTIGYATPGSFGTWAGVERAIPTLTLELPSRDSRQACWRANEPVFRSLLRGEPTS